MKKLKSLITESNILSLRFENNYGSVMNSELTFNHDSSELSISDVSLSGNYLVHGDMVYSKKDCVLDAKINSASSIDSISIKRDGQEVGTSLPFTITEEGIYSINVKTSSGKSLYQTFFDGKKITFDEENPEVLLVKFSSIKDTPDNPGGTGGSTVQAFNPEVWYNKNGVLTFTIKDNIGLSNKVSLKVNGTSYSVLSNASEGSVTDTGLVTRYSYTVNTSTFTPVSNGLYNMVFTTEDLVGNKVTYSAVLKLDISKPTYEGIKIDNIVYDEQGIWYIPDVVTLSGSFSDEGSGVKEVRYRDNDTFEYRVISLPCDVKTTGSFQIEDNAGNVQEYSVLALFNLLGIGSYVVDKESPVISVESINPDVTYSKDGIDFYSEIPTISYKITDENMKSVDFYVNGVKQDSTYNENDIYNYTLSGIEDGRVTVKVVATDKVRNTSTVENTFIIDSKAPENISVSAPSPVNTVNGNVYFHSGFDLSISATDENSGISGYILNSNQNSNGNFSISSDGEYYVSVFDNAKNYSEKIPLSKLLGWNGNKIVIDSESPTVKTIRPSGESKKANWYSKDVTYDVEIQDNKGISNAYVTINGTKVHSYNATSLDDTNVTLKVSTLGVKPNNDGSYNIVIYAEDNSKLSTSWSDTIYIDKNSPEVVDFIVSGNVKSISGDYQYIFDGNGLLQINVADKSVSSGIDSIWVKLGNQDWQRIKTNGDTVAYINIPENFKGTIQAYVEDGVGLKSGIATSTGLVSEGSNTHKNHSDIRIDFDRSNHYSSDNIPLYNKDINGTVTVSCDWSGLSYFEWGIGDTSQGTITNFNGASSWDKNLALKYDTKVALKGNSDKMTFWVKVIDNAGHVSEVSRVFGIDKDVPTIKVSYDKTVNGGFYNEGRTAKIAIKERNFDSSKFIISGKSGTLGSWKNEGGTWVNTMYFDTDGIYNFTLDVTDKAGNVAEQYNSGVFVVDKTAPELVVSWDNSNSVNGNYYSNNRTATITVIDSNFDSSLINIVGATVTDWESNGNSHTAKAVFTDGEHEFSITGIDKANHKLTTYKSGKFIIDTFDPEIIVEGVSSGVSYKRDVGFVVTIKGDYLDESSTYVALSGKNHGEIKVDGEYKDGEIIYTFSNFPKDVGTDDIYDLRIYAKGMSGIISSKELKFSVNRFGSFYSFKNESYLSKYLKSCDDISISEMNVDKLDTSKVKIVVTLDGKELSIPDNCIKISENEKDGKYLYTYTVDKSQFSKDGKYVIQIYSTAEDGTEYTSVAEQYDFVLDTIPATIVVSGIENGVRYQGYSRKATIDVRDVSGVDSIKVFLNDNEVETTLVNDMYELTIPENPETQTLKVVVTDKSGNTCTYEVKDFIVSSDVWSYISNQLWFKLILICIGVGVLSLILILVLRKKKDTKEEKKLVKENEAYYKSSSTTGKGISNDTSSDVGSDEKTDVMDNNDDNSKTDVIE